MFKSKKSQTLAVIALMAVAGSTFAAIPEAAQNAMDSVTETATTVVSWAWGVGTTLIAGFVGLKLVKKGANRAS